jgi:hypothetical protein
MPKSTHKVPILRTVSRPASINRLLTLSVIAIGSTLVLIVAGIDFSLGAVVALGGVSVIWFAAMGAPVWVAMIAAVVSRHDEHGDDHPRDPERLLEPAADPRSAEFHTFCVDSSIVAGRSAPVV